MATQTDLEIRGGDSKIYVLSFTLEGEVLPITDYTVFFTVKRYSWLIDLEAAVSKDITEMFDPTGGVAKITLDPEDTESLDPGIYLYDVQIKKSDGTILTILNGELEILYHVTKRRTV